MKEEAKVKSLIKAIQVLECFTTKDPVLGVSEIARKLGYNKATVYNIMDTYASMGYLVQDPATSKYHLGLKLLQFSYVINQQMDLTRRMEPYLQQIANKTSETVFLAVPYEDQVLYLATRTPHTTVPRTILGEKAPMYCTGLGKCLLAFTSEDKRPALPDTFPAFTNNTITTGARLKDELKLIRARGYAIDNMEHEFGVSCVAVPVFDHDKEPVCAVSVSGPSLRFDVSTIENIYKICSEVLREVQYAIW
ncbi:IclR family transcriptional regulator [Lachnoclostridium sp. Marseille-P6806]|uniref:IclR family transcriptional regulator n=1 Tax=Lachnoclostridium sp. Marseille-P6806 TaxID=2364793 RepID=UPI00103130D7|nr:IclR family transcriptional regulator [Lachnoclostridium sp. Marseille-P6806]